MSTAPGSPDAPADGLPPEPADGGPAPTAAARPSGLRRVGADDELWSAWDRRLGEELAQGPDPAALLQLSRELEARAGDDEASAARRRRLDRALGLARTAVQLGTWRSLHWLASLLTLLLPVLVVAAWYGMNFKTHASRWAMPELSAWWGYPLVLAVAVVLVLLGLLALRRADWRRLDASRRPPDERDRRA